PLASPPTSRCRQTKAVLPRRQPNSLETSPADAAHQKERPTNQGCAGEHLFPRWYESRGSGVSPPAVLPNIDSQKACGLPALLSRLESSCALQSLPSSARFPASSLAFPQVPAQLDQRARAPSEALAAQR